MLAHSKKLRINCLENRIGPGSKEISIYTAYCNSPDHLGRILIIYGGTTEKNFSHTVRFFWAEHLARLGFVVHFFDFRSNLGDSKFSDYGLYDRLQDSKAVIDYLLSKQALFKHLPLSLMGLGMGGHLAVLVASDYEYREQVKNLILIVPAAYNDKALSPNVKFGSEFSKIIRTRDDRRLSTIFSRSRRIKANCLVVACKKDEIVPSEIPWLYFLHLAQPRDSAARSYKRICELNDYGHHGNYDDSEKRGLIVQHLLSFFKNSKSLPSRPSRVPVCRGVLINKVTA